MTIKDYEPLELSQEIESFEIDFSNGHLIGEILEHYGLLNQLEKMTLKTNKEAKVHNFLILEKILREIKVNFDQ